MSVWTDKKIEKLKVLWDKGIPTAEIGKKLGFSKNAIVGKVHRLGLSNRNSPIKTSSSLVKKDVVKNVEKIKNVSKEKSQKHIIEHLENAEKIEENTKSVVSKNESIKKTSSLLKNQKKKNGEGVSLLELTSDICCWPIDEVNSENFHFCGKKVFKNRPYCLEHCAIAYINTTSQSEDHNHSEE